ncbi:FkbM family methyltransferase [Prosthecobacter sp.]|uniref:FkbM family methyltransferase n=1 Tax=Prosthecobacter sp. TaxID=1965333 RepID=UPI003783C561
MLSTESKIRLARVLYRLLKLAGFRDEQFVTRSGVRFQLDLREGIDLSLFLFGAFQNHILSVSPQSAAPVIFDVGANIGAITLPLAQKHPSAQIHSFEPTHYALEKLRRNLALNPALAQRVTVNACFVGRNSGTNSAAKAYASWPVDGTTTADSHAAHLGLMRDATAACTSLDDYVASNAIPRVHLIKIDTDGQEHEVLAGAQKLIASNRPRIIMEMCPHLLEENRLTLKDFADVLGPGYRMTDLQTGRAFDEQALARLPRRGGTDVLADFC